MAKPFKNVLDKDWEIMVDSMKRRRAITQFFIGLANKFNKRRDRKLYELIEMACDGKVNELKAALAANPKLGRGVDQDDMSALMHAAKNGRRACVEALIPASDPLAEGREGWPALVWAARYNHVKCVELLLPVSDPLAFDRFGRSALMFAAGNGHAACVAALLAVSDALAVNTEGQSALMYAAHFGHADCMKLLIPVSDPLAVTKQGMSALTHAALQGHADCAELLLPVSDLLMKSPDGKTALDLALESGHDQVVLAFERHQAKLEAAELSVHIGAATNDQESGASAPRKSARL